MICHAVARSIALSQLDYCYSISNYMPQKDLTRLQKFQDNTHLVVSIPLFISQNFSVLLTKQSKQSQSSYQQIVPIKHNNVPLLTLKCIGVSTWIQDFGLRFSYLKHLNISLFVVCVCFSSFSLFCFVFAFFDLVWFAMCVNMGKIQLNLGKVNIRPSSSVKNLGVTFDASLSMSNHRSVRKTVSYHIRNFRRICRFITQDACHSAVRALASSRMRRRLFVLTLHSR